MYKSRLVSFSKDRLKPVYMGLLNFIFTNPLLEIDEMIASTLVTAY